MFPRRPRLRKFDYVGSYRYFLTCCTDRRRRWFQTPSTIEAVLLQLQQSAGRFGFELIAWCFMPDHLHVLAAGTSPSSEFERFVKDFKQRAGFTFKQRTGHALWQPSFHDRVLRDEEATIEIARYILANPVRAGLVDSALAYPFSGSDVYRLEEIWQG